MNVTISYLPYYLVYSCRIAHRTLIVCRSFVKQRVISVPVYTIANMDKKKRQQFSLKEKREILLEVEKGGKKGGIAKKYGSSPSTLSTFLKQQSKIEQNIDADALGPQRKKMRTADYEEVDKAVYTWFVEMWAKNIPINGPLLCERARSFASSLGFPEFMGSTGWLHGFRERYGISHKIINGEANDAPKEVASSWRLETLPAALKEYSPVDIYNADETTGTM